VGIDLGEDDKEEQAEEDGESDEEEQLMRESKLVVLHVVRVSWCLSQNHFYPMTKSFLMITCNHY